jgi:hypothetical protein
MTELTLCFSCATQYYSRADTAVSDCIQTTAERIAAGPAIGPATSVTADVA